MSEKIVHDLVAERTATIVRNLASGANDCNVLMCNGKFNEAFAVSAVRPTIKTCIEEADHLRSENAALRKEVEAKRFALEAVIGNNGDLAAAKDALNAAMPAHPNLSHLN